MVDSTPSPAAVLMNLITGKFMTQAISTAAELRLADELRDGPLTAGELARRAGADAGAVYRLLRALAMAGVFTEGEGRSFSLTPVGDMLRTDVSGSLAGMARFFAQPWHHGAWSEMTHSVRTGESAFTQAHGAPLFQWLGAHPAESEVLSQAMVSLSSVLAQAVVAALDFRRFNRIADIGGGHGALLGAILKAAPEARGVLFDLPGVVAGAGPVLAEAGVADRCEVVGGDAFSGVPRGCDAYVIKHVIHDFSDDDAARLLGHCAAGMSPGGRVLVIETIVPGIGVPSFAKVLDLEMLVMTPGGRERTEDELRELLARGGLALERVVATRSHVSILEAGRA
jgi:O-methyltransferase/methyltransferase family protein